jgi:hypothetical protein
MTGWIATSSRSMYAAHLPHTPKVSARRVGTLSVEGFDSLILSNSVAPGADPLNEFMSSYGLSRHFDVTSDFSAFGHVDPLPLLPPPPPESLPASPAVEQLSEPGPSAPKSCRSRKEVDQTNILHLTRSRVPAARKRSVDEDVSSWLQKRGRRKQGRFRNSVSQSDHEFTGSIAPECPLENSVNFTQSGGKNIA